MYYLGPRSTILSSNYDPGLTLTHFTPRSILVAEAFVLKKVKVIYFSETTVAYDLKDSRVIELKE